MEDKQSPDHIEILQGRNSQKQLKS